MKIIIVISVFVLGTFSSMGQITAAVEKFALPSSLGESSGAIFFNNKLITHNDSGGENKLYELDTISGVVTRTVTISNAINVDWEDITHDNLNIYIGDLGNNNGNRTDLKIYRVDKNDYINNTIVTAETIAFSYADQTDFTPNTNTEWDCEALVSFDANNLMLFTKNWVTGITKAYLVPKVQGTYALTPLTTSLNSGGLITGGTFNPLTNKLFLVGYTYTIPINVLQPFVWESENFNGSDIFSGTNTQTFLPSFALEQAEAITYVSENRYFITSESFNQSGFSDYAKLIAFSTSDVTLSTENILAKNNMMLYPNPVKNMLYFENSLIKSVEIYDTNLTKLYSGNSRVIDISTFSAGIYMVMIHTNHGMPVIKKIVKK